MNVNDLYTNLGKNETYDCEKLNVWPFKKTIDIIEGIQLNLSNMSGSYPFVFNGKMYQNTEVLYLSGEFSNKTDKHFDIQKELYNSVSGYAAKRFIKSKYIDEIRSDFNDFRIEWMLFTVWQKCISNVNFCKKLLSIPDGVILIEDTTTDKSYSRNIWGCSNIELLQKRKEIAQSIIKEGNYKTKKELNQKISVEINKIRNIGVYTGQNNMGKILMLCRECLKQNITPPYNSELLNNKQIYINNQLLTF